MSLGLHFPKSEGSVARLKKTIPLEYSNSIRHSEVCWQTASASLEEEFTIHIFIAAGDYENLTYLTSYCQITFV
jgi:hypothetical protein